MELFGEEGLGELGLHEAMGFEVGDEDVIEYAPFLDDSFLGCRPPSPPNILIIILPILNTLNPQTIRINLRPYPLRPLINHHTPIQNLQPNLTRIVLKRTISLNNFLFYFLGVCVAGDQVFCDAFVAHWFAGWGLEVFGEEGLFCCVFLEGVVVGVEV